MSDDVRISPKLQKLCKWKHIDEVNRRLDAGETPNSVAKYIKQNGFKISNPLVYEYAKLRKKSLVDGVNVEHMVGIASKPLIDRTDPSTIAAETKLKSEIDALDMIIQGGYNTLLEFSDRPISASTLMSAIKLKNDLTDGNHGFLTNYGMEQLREIESAKYQLLMEHLIRYIPEELRQEALDSMESIEEDYYKSTPYYKEYLKARGDLTDQEIETRLAKALESQE